MSNHDTPIQQAIAEKFIQSVENILHENTDGIREYDLLTRLTNLGFFPESITGASPPLALFQKHFLLFHVLYLINDKLLRDNAGSLNITPLVIQKLGYIDATTELGQHDPLREYYLDLQNLESTNEEKVNELLSSFWECYLRNDKRQDALAVLGLADPVEDQEIKTSYRRLVKTHHPDKGGQTSVIQEINEAYKLLIKS